MSRENVEVVVEVVRGVFQAFSTRDIERFVELHHPDAEIWLPRSLLEGGSYRGLDGVRRAFQDLLESWDEIQGDFPDVREAADHLVALGRVVNVSRGGGPPVEYELALVIRLRDGKILYWRPCLSHQEALEAVGLSE